MKNTVFSLTNLTDSDISRLLKECQHEQTQRQLRRQAERKKWVEGMYCAYMAHPNAAHVQVDDVTVVSFFNRNTGTHMGIARPVHGDTFDRTVGIAVAYAKATGTTIPDFV